jgi:hypothetical protein
MNARRTSGARERSRGPSDSATPDFLLAEELLHRVGDTPQVLSALLTKTCQASSRASANSARFVLAAS